MCFDGRKPEAGALMRSAGAARGVVPARCPACSSREVAHDPGESTRWWCRGCGLEWRRPGLEPVAPPPEDRGTPLWVWRDVDGWPSFERPRAAAERCEVSAPIGRRLATEPTGGVVLTDVFGVRMTAARVLRLAERGEGGFKVRGREAVG